MLARITKTLSELTGEKFKPLEYDRIEPWRSENKSFEVYHSNYDDYFWVEDDIKSRIKKDETILSINAAVYLARLKNTINSHPNAIHARCLRGGFLTMIGLYEEAEKEFEEVRKIKSDYRWLKVWEPALLLKKDKIKEAEDLAISAIKQWPNVEWVFKYWNVFSPIKESILKSDSTTETVVD